MTLIEIMLAVALTAVLGTLTYGVIFTTVSTQDDAMFIQDRFHAGRVALERMRHELTMAYVSLHQADDKRTKTAFHGEQDKLVFDTAANEPLTKDQHLSDQMEVEYRLDHVPSSDDPNVSVQALVRRVKYHIDDRPGVGGRDEVLIERVKSVEFAYFDKNRGDWTDSWSVQVDDAMDMRAKLKQLQQLRDQVEGVGDDDTTGVAGVVVAAQADKQVDDLQQQLEDGMFLPSRVRVKIVLEDREGDQFPMETQAEVTMVSPLWY